MGLEIKAKITSQGRADKYRYKTGPAAGLERAEIRVPKKETKALPYREHQYPVSIVLVWVNMNMTQLYGLLKARSRLGYHLF